MIEAKQKLAGELKKQAEEYVQKVKLEREDQKEYAIKL